MQVINQKNFHVFCKMNLSTIKMKQKKLKDFLTLRTGPTSLKMKLILLSGKMSLQRLNNASKMAKNSLFVLQGMWAIILRDYI